MSKRNPVVPICLLTIIVSIIIIYPGFSPYTALAHIAPSWRSSGLTMRIEPSVKNVELGHTFTVDVMIDQAVNLGAFQFEMLYDSAVLTVTSIELGPFLGSTGRTAQPIGLDIDNVAGIASFGAFSFGDNMGPEGTGLLATVTFTTVGSGTSALNLQNVLVTDTMANAQTPSAEGGTVTVAAPAPTSTPTGTPSPTVPPTAEPTPTSPATATDTAEPVVTITPTVTATVTATAPPVAPETATPVPAATLTLAEPSTSTPAGATATSETTMTPTALPTPIAPLTSTPAETPQPKATVTSTLSPTPGAVSSPLPTFTPPPPTSTAVKLPSPSPRPSSPATDVSFDPLCWVEMFLFIVAGCAIYELVRRYRE